MTHQEIKDALEANWVRMWEAEKAGKKRLEDERQRLAAECAATGHAWVSHRLCDVCNRCEPILSDAHGD